MRQIVIFLLVICNVNCQESTQYLQNAVRDLRRQTLRRADTVMAQIGIKENPPQLPADKRVHEDLERPPPLSLTKGELIALYENAIAKGDTLKLNTGNNKYIHTALHELDEDKEHSSYGEETKNDDGYYYYYYPIKSFLDEMTSMTNSHGYISFKPQKSLHVHTTTYKPPYTYHSHHHEHNVHIKKEIEEKKPTNKLEPLFMAISGFVGMAVMFVISMIILPKFGSKPPKKTFWPKSEDMDELARLALNAIEGNDCRERFSCELSKTTRNFNMQENRILKLLRRIAPNTFENQINKYSSYGNGQLKCTLIPCKKKLPPKNSKKFQLKKKNVAQKKN